MARLPSLNALRAFEAAARLGRMTLAAEELAVTHGAVSHQIKTLEDQLGCKLLDGPRNRLALTESGKRLLPVLTSAFEQIGRGVADISPSGSRFLDVSCLGTLTMRWLIPRMHRFQSEHPTIEVRLTTDDGPVDFSRRLFDVAIRVGRGDWPADAQVTSLFSEHVGPVLSPNLLAPGGRSGSGDLRQLPKLHTQTRLWAWEDWISRTSSTDVSLDGQKFEHFYFALEAATAGLGVAIAPWELVIDDIKAGRLVAPLGFVESGQSYVALSRQGRKSPTTQFVRWLEAEAKLMPTPLHTKPVGR